MQQHPRPSICLSALLLLAISSMVASPVPSAAQRTRHSEVTEVVVVEVPVQVIKDGEPVRGLTADQFEVLDGRKRQDLIGFDVYDLSAPGDEPSQTGSQLPAAARRHFMLFFDLSFSDPASIVRARHAAKELVSTGLSPSDLVGVATYSASSGSKLILGFTSDRSQVGVAIDTLGLPQLVESRRDPLGLTFADMPESWGSTPTSSPDRRGVDVEAEVREAVTRLETSSSRATDRNDILALASSLAEVAELLRSVDGRKYLVYLSEGFNSSIVVGQGGGSTREEQQAIQRQNDAAAYGDYQDVSSDVRFGDTSTQNDLGRMLQEFVRADCVIQAVDIGGLRAGADVRPRRENKQGLFMLADGTGGEFVENFNNLTVALEKVLDRTSVTYVLAFQAKDLKLDGEFHKLKVKLKGGPKGARLAYRPGYFAPKPYSEVSQRERIFSAASRIYGESSGQVETSALAAPFEIASQMAYVPTLVEIDGVDLLRGNQGGTVTAEIYGYAVADDGQVKDFFNQTIGIDVAKAGPTLQETGLKFFNQFELPPGTYDARILVRNASTGASGVSVFRFQVPDSERKDPVLLPPMFPEQAGKWLIVRGQRAEEATHDYPFTVQGEPFIPAVKPVLTPGQAAAVLLSGYGLGDSVQMSAELVDLTGEPVDGVSLNLGERRLAADPAMAQWTATLSLGPQEAGEYLLRFTATDPESGETYSSNIKVTVTS
jgi:VWFA-related protein